MLLNSNLNALKSPKSLSIDAAIEVPTSGGYYYKDISWTLPSGATFLGISYTIIHITGSGSWGTYKTVHHQAITSKSARVIVGCGVGGTTVTVRTYVYYSV